MNPLISSDGRGNDRHELFLIPLIADLGSRWRRMIPAIGGLGRRGLLCRSLFQLAEETGHEMHGQAEDQENAENRNHPQNRDLETDNDIAHDLLTLTMLPSRQDKPSVDGFDGSSSNVPDSDIFCNYLD